MCFLVITVFMYHSVDKNADAWDLTLDISKVFDMFWHAGLLQVLKAYNASGWIFDLIESFISANESRVDWTRF